MESSSHPVELLITDVVNFLQVIDINDRTTHDVYRSGHEFIRLLRQYVEDDQKQYNIQLIKNCWSKS